MPPRSSRSRASSIGLLALLIAATTTADVVDAGVTADELAIAIARGDAAWSRRAEGPIEHRGAPGPIGEAVAAYEDALAQAPGDLEARWKLLRALFFSGEHVAREQAEQLAIFSHGREIGERGLELLMPTDGDRKQFFQQSPERLRAVVAGPTLAAEILFWSAVHTGLWGRAQGKLASARTGVAGKIRDYASAAVALDATIENRGGHRLLGRLHSEAPRIPLITGWIDRETAVRELEICFEFAPSDLTTRLYLGEALARFVPERRQEGLAMLREVVAQPPNPDWLIEEWKAIADARAALVRFD